MAVRERDGRGLEHELSGQDQPGRGESLVAAGPEADRQPVGPYYDAIDVVPGFQSPYTLTKYLPLGAASSLMYNWVTAPVSFKTLGIYMVDHLDLDERLRHKRVGVLERRE